MDFKIVRFEDFKVQVSNIKVQTLHLGSKGNPQSNFCLSNLVSLKPHLVLGLVLPCSGPAFKNCLKWENWKKNCGLEMVGGI